MRAITICHAETDKAFRLAAFLHDNLNVEVYPRAVEDLIADVDFGLSGDAVVVLLSPGATPAEVPRREWEPVLLDKRVAHVLLEDCTFPALLRRERFFDGRSNLTGAFRGIKRWLLGTDWRREPPSQYETLLAQLADRPGLVSGVAAEEAFQFASQCSAEFESIVHVDGRGRTLPSISTEVAAVKGRSLLVVRGASADVVSWIGVIRDDRTSVLSTVSEPSPAPDYASVRAQLLAAGRGGTEPDEASFDRAMQATDDPDLVRLAGAYLKRIGRSGEALDLVTRVLECRPALDDLARDRVWLLDQLGATETPTDSVAASEAQQLSLFDQA